MIYPFISFNLSIIPLDKSPNLLSDQGFLYGYGLFETLRINNNIPLRLDSHLERLFLNAQSIFIPVPFNSKIITRACFDLIKKLDPNNGILNIYLSAGNKNHQQSNLFIIIRSLPPYIDQGIKHLGFKEETFSSDSLQKYKSLSRLKYELELKIAKQHTPHIDDVLLFDKQGFILETTIANVFFINKNQEILTPNLGKIINGVFRKHLIKKQNLIKNYIIERPIHVNEIVNFKEIFLTNSVRNIIMISELENSHLSSGKVSEEIRSELKKNY